MKNERGDYEMNIGEWDAFHRIQPVADAAWEFWRSLGRRYGFDYRTVMSSRVDGYASRKFTALPLGHTKHWCWPMELKCKNKP